MYKSPQQSRMNNYWKEIVKKIYYPNTKCNNLLNRTGT